MPFDAPVLRAWDLAASKPSKKNKDTDWTVGTKWMVDFLSENSDINKITLWLLKIDKGLSDKIFETIKDSRFRGVFGKTETKDSEKATQPYNAVLVYLCEKLSIDPERFQNEYTIEQMNYLIEWTIYNANSQTEEGQVENERTQFNKNNADEDLLDLIN